MNDPVFKVGQKIEAQVVLGARYYLTVGKVYEVLEYVEPYRADNGFQFPAYVDVISDVGTRVRCHTTRFKPVDGS